MARQSTLMALEGGTRRQQNAYSKARANRHELKHSLKPALEPWGSAWSVIALICLVP